MAYPRKWNDQPKEIEDAEVRLSFFCEGTTFELREKTEKLDQLIRGYWYITSGNLFGSQTIRCDGVKTALQILNDAIRAVRNDSSIAVSTYKYAVLLPEGTMA